MISRIQAKNFRCLRYIDRRLDRFHVMVGANASGKSTFLDVIGFLSDLVANGLDAAISKRTSNFEDLVWARANERIQLAVEAPIPKSFHEQLPPRDFSIIRYEIELGLGPEGGEVLILNERGLLIGPRVNIPTSEQRSLFPFPEDPPETILLGKHQHNRTVFSKIYDGNDNFYSEVDEDPGKGWLPPFRLGSRKSTLGNLPAYESKLPVSTWLKRLLADGTQKLMLNSALMRLASPPGQPKGFKPDGSNLPWVIDRLHTKYPDRFQEWIAHIQTALPDVSSVRTVERPEDRHRYLVIEYRGGLVVPSWMASDGTLRLLALTLIAYLEDFSGIYLIEEPENGIHPKAVETVVQSLSSVYGAQLLLATHSPIILGISDPEQVLCFAKNESGATDIVTGLEHPALQDWKHEVNLGVLYAAGVLG